MFKAVLDAVLAQKTPWPFEVQIVDSGSSDGSHEYARSRDVAIHHIPPSQFGHGRTRNLAISLTSGAFIAMITHDAKPASTHWLSKLVAAVEQEDRIAGAFGRHLPYGETDPYTARDITLHFDAFARQEPVVWLNDQVRYKSSDTYRQFLHFFSDNNACVRRSVWEKIPYPDVEYAEDQIWAQRIIEAGYAKAYCDEAAVFHSHQYSVIQTLQRSYDESAALRRLFGYELCSSLPRALAQTLRLALRDVLYSMRGGRALTDAFWMARSPFAEGARQLGHYLGGREGRLPLWLEDRISLDRRFKASGAAKSDAA